MTESLRQLAENLVFGSSVPGFSTGGAFFLRHTFFLRHNYPLPHAGSAGRRGWWQAYFAAGDWPGAPEVCCSGESRAAAFLVLVVEAMEAEGREVPTELRAAATLLLAEGAAYVGWRAP